MMISMLECCRSAAINKKKRDCPCWLMDAAFVFVLCVCVWAGVGC